MRGGKFSYPLPVTRKRYLTELGGRSDLLEENQIGLHAEALLSNTDLKPGEAVLLDSAGGKMMLCPLPLHPFIRDMSTRADRSPIWMIPAF